MTEAAAVLLIAGDQSASESADAYPCLDSESAPQPANAAAHPIAPAVELVNVNVAPAAEDALLDPEDDSSLANSGKDNCDCLARLLCIEWALVFVIGMLSLTLMLVVLQSQQDAFIHEGRISMIDDARAKWMQLISAQSFAAKDLQQTLDRSFPDLIGGTLTMNQLQSTRGWLSGFSSVASRYPELDSFGMMAASESSNSSLFVQYTREGATLDAAGGVRIDLLDSDGKLLSFRPSRSLHPVATQSADAWPGEGERGADTIFSDSPELISNYLGSAWGASGGFNVSTNPIHAFADRLGQGGEGIGLVGTRRDETVFGGGIVTVATTPAAASSQRWSTFASYSPATLRNYLSQLSPKVRANGAYLLSNTGWILATSTNDHNISPRYVFDSDFTNADLATKKRRLVDFIGPSGFISNDGGGAPYRSQIIHRTNGGDGGDGEDIPAIEMIAFMLPGMPNNGQLILVLTQVETQLYDSRQQLTHVLSAFLLLIPLLAFINIANAQTARVYIRLTVVAQVLIDYWRWDATRHLHPRNELAEKRRHVKQLLRLIRWWKDNSPSNMPLPERIVDLTDEMLVFQPLAVPPVHGSLEWTLRFKRNNAPKCSLRSGDVRQWNYAVERLLVVFVLGECNKHYPAPAAGDIAAQ